MFFKRLDPSRLIMCTLRSGFFFALINDSDNLLATACRLIHLLQKLSWLHGHLACVSDGLLSPLVEAKRTGEGERDLEGFVNSLFAWQGGQ